MIDIITDVACKLFIKAVTILPSEVISALKKAYQYETSQIAKENLSIMIENAEVAKKNKKLICQDTGLPFYFLKVGENFPVSITDIYSAIKDGCKKATIEFPLRPNVVDVLSRKNTLTNTGEKIPIIDIEYIKNESNLQITMLPKGAGSENMSRCGMLLPSEGLSGVKKFVIDTVRIAGANPCPPTIVGVGIGGSFDTCTKLAKKSLIRKIEEYNKNQEIEILEKELLDEINKCGIGPMGLGGKTTSLWVAVECVQTHIAMLPVAVNIQCWVARRSSALILKNGIVKYERT